MRGVEYQVEGLLSVPLPHALRLVLSIIIHVAERPDDDAREQKRNPGETRGVFRRNKHAQVKERTIDCRFPDCTNAPKYGVRCVQEACA